MLNWSICHRSSFKAIVQDSPTGNLTFGAYDVYIKTLMMVYEDEMYDLPELDSKSNGVFGYHLL
jgi:hypothetical protein